MSDRESDSYRNMSLEEAPPVRRIVVGLLCQQDSETRIELRVSLTVEDLCRVYEGQSDPGQRTIVAICSALGGGVFYSQPFDHVELLVPPMIKSNLIVLLPITTGSEVHYHQYCCVVRVSRKRPLTKGEIVHILQHQFCLQEARLVSQVICHSRGEVDSNTEGGECIYCTCTCVAYTSFIHENRTMPALFRAVLFGMTLTKLNRTALNGTTLEPPLTAMPARFGFVAWFGLVLYRLVL